MRGKDNSNYIQTRELCNNMSKVFQLSKRITFNFLKCIHKAMIHRIAEDSLDNKLQSDLVSMEIPFIGKLSLRVEDNLVVVDSLELEDEFKSEVLKAVNEGESPLVIAAEESLVKIVNQRYNSLL